MYKSKHHYLEEINQLLKSQARNLNVLQQQDVVPGVLCIVEDDLEYFRARIDFHNGAEALVRRTTSGFLKSDWRVFHCILISYLDLGLFH